MDGLIMKRKNEIRLTYIAKPGETIEEKQNVYNDIETKIKLAGLILLSFEILKNIVIKPIKCFYDRVTFSDNSPLKSYENDVLSRDKYEFKSCLLYLCDFMEAIKKEDISTIMELMEKRNDVAHELISTLEDFDFDEYYRIALATKDVLFKLSNFRIRMDLMADPDYKELDWEEVVGDEYILFEKVLQTIKRNINVK
jgi:hypothetical protein